MASIIRCKTNNTYNGAEFTVTVNGAPLNLQGASLKMQLRINANTPLVKEYNTGSGLTITDGVNGKFTFDEQLIDVVPGSYQYDILATLSNGVEKTYPSGQFIVEAVITHG